MAKRSWLAVVPAFAFGLVAILALVDGQRGLEPLPTALARGAIGLGAALIGLVGVRRSPSPVAGRWRIGGWVAVFLLFFATYAVERPILQALLQTASGLIWWLMYPEPAGWVIIGGTALISLLAAVAALFSS